MNISLHSLSFSDFCFRLSVSLGHLLWQAVVLSALGFLLTFCCRSAHTRYAVWYLSLCLTAMLLPVNYHWITATSDIDSAPVVQPPVADSAPAPDVAVGTTETTAMASLTAQEPVPVASAMAVPLTDTPPVAASLPWAILLTTVYSAGVMLMTIRLCVSLQYGQRLRGLGTVIQESHILVAAQRCAAQLGLSCQPLMLQCTRTLTPVVVGVLRPVVILPASLLAQLNTAEMEAVLLHELAHIVRGDHLMNLAQKLIESLLFFHPAVWWMTHHINAEREYCCDDLATAGTGDVCTYAETLIRVSELRSQSLVCGNVGLALAADRPSRLKKRVQRILAIPSETPQTGLTRRGMAVLAGCSLLACVLVGQIGISAEPPDSDLLPPDESAVTAATETEAGAPEQSANTTSQPGTKPASVSPAASKTADADAAMEVIRVIHAETGKGIAGAIVTYDPAPNPRQIDVTADSMTAVASTDDNGEVSLPLKTLEYLLLRVTHPRFLRSRMHTPGMTLGGGIALLKTPWGYGTVRGQKVIRLWPGENLSGVIRYRDGSPVANLQIGIRCQVNDPKWMQKTSESREWTPQPGAFSSLIRTTKDGSFSTAVPPSALVGALTVSSSSTLSAPFHIEVADKRPLEISVERGCVVRGLVVDNEGLPVGKTSVTLCPAASGDDPGRSSDSAMVRVATTDAEGRFELAPCRSGHHILRPYQGVPQRLEIAPAQKRLEIEAHTSHLDDLSFELHDTRRHKPGAENVVLRGEMIPGPGQAPVAISATSYLTPDRMVFRVPRGMQNGTMDLRNFLHQVVHVTEPAGTRVPGGPADSPLRIPLSSPPRLGIWMSTGVPLRVNILEADGKPAGDLRVTGQATGKFGSRDLPLFHRLGHQWESPGLYEGEQVRVTVHRGNWTARSKLSEPVQLEGTRSDNALEFRLPEFSTAETVPADGVYFSYTGYMSQVLELKKGRFRFWFESDAKRPNGPKYPLSGKYTIHENTISLQHELIFPPSVAWKSRTVNGIPSLWRRDALEADRKGILKLNMDYLRRNGAGSILVRSSKRAEDLWQHRGPGTL